MTGEIRLRAPKNTVDPRAVRWWTTQALLAAVPLVAALSVVVVLFPGWRWLTVTALVAAVVYGVVDVLIMPRWRYRIHRWEVTDEAVYARSGWLWQEWRVAPMSRIQTVDTARGPLQQYFALSTLTVTTASAKGAIIVAGLDRDVAADLVAELTRIAQTNRADAT